MPTVSSRLRRLLAGDLAATAVEYALLGAMIAGACALAVGVLGISVDGLFADLNSRW